MIGKRHNSIEQLTAWFNWLISYLIVRETKSLENIIVKPVDFQIPADATKIHGISTRVRNLKGSLYPMHWRDFEVMSHCDVVIAHNLNFDEKIVSAECLRLGSTNVWF